MADAAELLDSGERLDAGALRAVQLERMRASLRHAYEHVPFYRESFDKAGVRPDDCRSLTDLARFPFTTKADLREHYPYGMFAVPRDHVRRTGGLGAHYGAERLGCTVVPASGGMTARQVQLIQDLEPGIIMVTPSYMLTLLDEFERQGVDPRGTSLRVGVFGAEPWTEEMRSEIEERFAIDAVDIYGLSEVIGPGVAQECVQTKDGLHVWEGDFY
ncbi:MAG: AMP-binding protein, partial [Streptomyces sp.]|nr:AMP-binding protein [Streptomyces sp.]